MIEGRPLQERQKQDFSLRFARVSHLRMGSEREKGHNRESVAENEMTVEGWTWKRRETEDLILGFAGLFASLSGLAGGILGNAC